MMDDNIILSIAPQDPARLDACRFSVELVNDSPRQLSFSISMSVKGPGRALLRHQGVLEAGMCLTLETPEATAVAQWSDFIFQGLLLGPAGEAEVAEPVNVHCRMAPELFRRESSFRHPLYSEAAALELPIVRDGRAVSYAPPDAERIKEALAGKPADGLSELMAKYNSDVGRRRKLRGSDASNPNKVLPTVEVDLHIHELVDSTAGLDNTAMMELQLDTVRHTMREHQRRHGQRIVFIHGKGDGVLRAAVRKLLSKEFRSCQVEDADFRRYGFGATLVIVHHSSH